MVECAHAGMAVGEARHLVRCQVPVIRLGKSGEFDPANRVPADQTVVEGLFHDGGEALVGLADAGG